MMLMWALAVSCWFEHWRYDADLSTGGMMLMWALAV